MGLGEVLATGAGGFAVRGSIAEDDPPASVSTTD
jgi:hypothetical protein